MQPFRAPLYIFVVQHFEKTEKFQPNIDLCHIKPNHLSLKILITMIDLFQHLDGLFASLFHLVLTVGKLGLLVFIGYRLYPHIRKHFAIGHKPSGSTPHRPQAPGVYNAQQATQYANNAQQHQQTPVDLNPEKFFSAITRLYRATIIPVRIGERVINVHSLLLLFVLSMIW